MCGGRVIYVQGRSDHGRISRDFWQNRPANVSRASAFAEGTHPDRGFASVFVTAPDGLRLHIRSYGSSVASALPVVCLPALARTAADFHPLAAALATDPAKPRLVLALDYRGHGQSTYDRNPNNFGSPGSARDHSGHICRHVFWTAHGKISSSWLMITLAVFRARNAHAVL